MRKTALALIAVAGVAAVVSAPTANAFGTCSSVHSWCGPQESNKGTNRDGNGYGDKGTPGTSTSVQIGRAHV